MASPILEWLRSSPLGSGAFASVSLAINLHDGSLFAVKSSPYFLDIQRELHILHLLDSPRVIRCLGSDCSSKNEVHNLFLEYMAGGSVADLFKRCGGKLEEHRVRLYTREILEGLNYVHQQGIVHCDIKAENILVGSSGVKIADFGAAKSSEEGDSGGCDAGRFRGTPLWMAPEVVQGVEQGPASDIWSLGCTVVEMLQGRPPWNDATDLATLLFQIGCCKECPPLPDSSSSEAKDFLRKCLHPDPKARSTAAQLLEHPFVRPQTKGICDSPRYDNQLSPRSTLAFCCESDWEDESMNSVPIMSLPRRPGKTSRRPTTTEEVDWQPRSHVSSVPSSIPRAGEWITVRRTDRWSEDREKPFMKGLGGEDDPKLVQMRKGSEVNLDSLAFLRNRRSAK